MSRYYSSRNKRHISHKRRRALNAVKFINRKYEFISYSRGLWWIHSPIGRDWVTTPIEPLWFGSVLK